jgi:hypothetical protein
VQPARLELPQQHVGIARLGHEQGLAGEAAKLVRAGHAALGGGEIADVDDAHDFVDRALDQRVARVAETARGLQVLGQRALDIEEDDVGRAGS